MKFIASFINKKNIVPILVIGIALLFTALLIGYCVLSIAPVSDDEDERSFPFFGESHKADNTDSSEVLSYINGEIPSIKIDRTEELRGVWIATVMNINFPSEKGVAAERMAKEIDDIIVNCERAGFNAVFFQVRPGADAFYPSDIFPWSEYISGEQGKAPEGGFDPLAYFIVKAHEKNIALHAWINPYRITTGNTSNPKHDVSTLCEGHPARLHPEYTVPYGDGKLYFNPGLPEVRELCVSGVKELLEKYPSLDGIHFDDYFYPYPVSGEEFDDKEAYSEYGGGKSLGDWRRENVTSLIRDVYKAVKRINPECYFGVSPFGIWANSSSDTYIKGSETKGLESYFSLYCDPIAWANEGIVDYLAPQIYWSFASDSVPFDTLARWWNANLDGTGVDVYIGHAAYKAEDYFATAASVTGINNTISGYGDIVTHNASEFALVGNALVKADIATGSANGNISVKGTDVAVKGLGSAAFTASTAYATAAQGALADSAVQPDDLAAIATTGSTDDLVQGAKILVLDGGTSADL